jgi:hypothetical protein
MSLANEVDWIDSDYTSWDSGETYRPDPNYHFRYEGKYYYIKPDKDVNDQSTWENDTKKGWHLSNAGYQEWQLNQQQFQNTLNFNNQMLDELRRRNQMQERWYAEERQRLAEEKAKADKAAAELKEKEQRRLYLAGLGRKTTLLTGGAGLSDPAPLHKQKLGAV